MELLPLVRKEMFWARDFFAGSKVKKHYKDIEFILENYNSDESEKMRKSHLTKLISHAVKTVPYYQKYYNEVDFEELPVINKEIIRGDYDAFKSSEFLETSNNKIVMTSGSTGAPFKITHNQDKRLRNSADMIYFMGRAGYELGKKVLFMKVWNNINRKSHFTRFMENIVPYSVFNYTDEDIAKFLSDIESDSNEKNIVCFASTCKVIVDYMREHKIEPKNYNIKSIIANSDALDDEVKNGMEHYFMAPTVSRYSNIEGGMLAQQNPNEGYEFNVNWASFLVELLDLNEDKPVKPGEIGRVVITDLFNYSMPLLRYYTGDLARWSNQPDKYGAPRIEKIVGRSDELIRDVNDKIVTSYIVAANTWKYTDIKQFQFIQTGHGEYTFILNPLELPFKREGELIDEFKGYLGESAKITIEYVHDIPLLDSGKRKLVINQMK